MISWAPLSSSERERKFPRHLFTSSIKCEIRHFHIVVVPQWQTNVKKAWCMYTLVCLRNKPIAVLTLLLLSPLSLLKLPGESAILLTKFFPFQGESDPRSWVCNNILGSFRWIKRWCWNCSKPFGCKHKLHKVCIFTPKLWKLRDFNEICIHLITLLAS